MRRVIYLIKIIFALLFISLINFKELLNSKQRGKVMTIYFTIIGISMILGILISVDKQPESPTVIIMDMLQKAGLGEK